MGAGKCGSIEKTPPLTVVVILSRTHRNYKFVNIFVCICFVSCVAVTGMIIFNYDIGDFSLPLI